MGENGTRTSNGDGGEAALTMEADMTSRDFCYWLQGALEVHTELSGMTNEKLDVIKKHLSLVFQHEIDPSFGGPEHQAKLNATHLMKPGDSLIRC